MRIQVYISFTVLILIQKSTSEAASRPSPPANMSIQCDSYGVEVRWEYPYLSQAVHFFVEVTDGDNVSKTNTTQNLSLNISSMMSTSLTNRYLVIVTAVRGGQKSDPRKSDIFSYNTFATISKIKCYLDFPEVELSPKDGKLHVQFINPVHLYRNTPALRDLAYDLEYIVKTEEHEINTACKMETETCETSIVFSEHRGKYCVSLTGEIGQRQLKPRSSCFIGDIRIYPSFTVYLYPVLGVALTLIFITGIILLLVKKYYSEIKKTVDSEFSKFLVWPAQTDQAKTLTPVAETVVSDLQIEPEEQTTLLEMHRDFSDEETSSCDRDVGSGDSGRAYGFDEDYSGESLIGYDCPHALRLEMSPGDTVKGYGQRQRLPKAISGLLPEV